jgi:hypothetical protein
MTNGAGYGEMVDKTFRIFSEEAKGAPQAYTFMLSALDFALGPAYNVIVVGDLHEEGTVEMLEVLRKQYMPTMTVSLRQSSQAGKDYEMLEDKATAYICRDKTCMPATNSIPKMLELLGIK